MDFANNYLQPITLAAGATSAALELPDGQYRLTLTDESRTRWEIVGATVASGTAVLERGLEGTADQQWGEGSSAFCTVTAGVLRELFARLAAAEAAIIELQGGGGGGELGEFGGAASGQLFFMGMTGGGRKAKVIDLQTGAVTDAEGLAWQDQSFPPGALSYNAEFDLLAMFRPGGESLDVLRGSDFTSFASTALVAGGGAAVISPGGSLVLAVRQGEYVKPLSLYLYASPPRLEYTLGSDEALPGAVPTAPPLFSPDGAVMYVPTGSGIQRRDTSTFGLVDTVLDEQIFQFVLSADGSTAAVRSYSFSSYGVSIRIVETTTWTVLARFEGYDQTAIGGDMTVRMAFNPANPMQLAVAVESWRDGQDLACVVLDANYPGSHMPFSPAADVDPDEWAGRLVAWSPAGDRLYIATSNALHAYRTTDWSYAGTLPDLAAEALVVIP